MREFNRLRLQLFARRGGRNYMMRSEKRPSYNSAPRPRPVRKRRTHHGYLVLTLLVSILLWPVGLFLIWNRRLRCGAGGKLLWSVATLVVFCGLALALLNAPTSNPDLQRFQDGANDFITMVRADAQIAWETFAERSGDAMGNMRTVGCSVGNFLLTKAADGIDEGVRIAQDVRNWASGLLGGADDASQDVSRETQGGDIAASASPEPSPGITPSPTPDTSPAPSATTDAAGVEPAQVAASGLSLIQAALRGGEEAEASPTPGASADVYPTPTARARSSASDTPDASSVESEAPDASATPNAAAATTPQPVPAVEPAPVSGDEAAVEPKPAGEFTVYHTSGGSWYHTTENCSGMRGAQAYTLAESVADGFEPCSRCDAPAAELVESEDVVWADEAAVYHVSDECPDFSGAATLMTREEAAQAVYAPCERCAAATTVVPVPSSSAEPTDTDGETVSANADMATEAERMELARDVTVYFYDGSVGYHAESTCYGMRGAPARTLYEAIEMGKRACSSCNPPTLEDLG